MDARGRPGLREAARDAGTPLSAAAAVVFRVKALEGLEDALAEAIVDLWSRDAASLNDTVVPLE